MIKKEKIKMFRALGFEKQADALEKGLCPLCYNKVDINSFKDALSKKEFDISGMCQFCQDKFFVTGEQ